MKWLLGQRLRYYCVTQMQIRKIYNLINDDNALIYHAEIVIGNQRILMTDDTGNTVPKGNTVSLALTFETADEVKAAYGKYQRDVQLSIQCRVHPIVPALFH